MAKLPENQRCQFLIGPVSSWFMPNTGDIWTQPKRNMPKNHADTDIMDCDLSYACDDNTNLSYFIYGSIGCFCYGQIHHNSSNDNQNFSYVISQQQHSNKATLSASVNRLIDIKEDNSRVACVRFLKTSLWPLAMILTESGSFIIHDCLSSKNLIHYRKSELISKFVEPLGYVEASSNNEHCKKKAKFNVTQQINSCLWPDARNAFLGISLLKEKTNLLFWLKLKDLTKIQEQPITKSDLIESFERLELNLSQYSSPICCMESSMLNEKTCLISLATDDGLITIVNVNFEQGQAKRVIKLPRHNDQVCSMSFFTGNTTKFPLGLLASVSRDGLTLIWDIENEFNFADYQASSEGGGKYNKKINWFALSFLPSTINMKHLNLALSNLDSGITLLEVPENARSKIRLKGKKQGNQNNQTVRHHKLLFNVAYNPSNEILMTSSLDGNHVFWNCCKNPCLENNNNKNSESSIEVKPQYLYPSMPNDSRTHMLRFNPIKEDLLGMAIGKAGLRFHVVSANPMKSRFDMSLSSASIARKITKANLSPTSIAWHPSNEYRLVIGTLEGKVLRADLTPGRSPLIEAEHKPIIRSRMIETSITKPMTYQNDDVFGVEFQPLERADQINEFTIDKKKPNTGANQQQQKNQSTKTDGVYSICWGPNPTCSQDLSRLAVYAIGSISNRLFIYHKKEKNSDKLTNYLDEFFDESLPEAVDEASEVAWKSSMDLMALGTTHGKIIIVSYSNEQHIKNNHLFIRLAVIQGPLGHSYIQCLSWHPTIDKDDLRYYYLATSSNESPAFVFNIRENILVEEVRDRLKIEDNNSTLSLDVNSKTDNNKLQYIPNKATNIISDYIYEMNGHKKAISDIAWNPHKSDELATSSFDRHCYVWTLKENSSNISCINETTDNNRDGKTIETVDNNELFKKKAKITSSFVARDRLFTLEWSLVDDDLIFTSGHDSTIWAWRPSENVYTNCPS